MRTDNNVKSFQFHLKKIDFKRVNQECFRYLKLLLCFVMSIYLVKEKFKKCVIGSTIVSG